MTTTYELHKDYTIENKFFKCVAHGSIENGKQVFVMKKYGYSEKGTLYMRLTETAPRSGQYAKEEIWQ
jgi:hypothetical protein